MNQTLAELYADLAILYGEELARPLFERLNRRLVRFQSQHPRLASPPQGGRFSESDSILITYGDMVYTESEAPLQTLAHFLKEYVAGAISIVHILPFFPYSSDDGFSIIDHRAVDPNLGAWHNVVEIGEQFRLMFDTVVNHISAKSAWFQGFLDNDPKYKNYFTVVEPGTDLSLVFRPRTLPLLTPVQQVSEEGGYREKLVWTTFSPDQVDINFREPDLLFDVIDILLFYVTQGVQFIRLDAIAFIWKEIGTSCIHLPQTHRIIQLIRKVLDFVAPGVTIITETNVPLKENISYFGDGTNEAQMVYNFSLPPLTLNAFHTGNAETLSKWADSLRLPSEQVTFLNFLASHDGIGVNPATGILSPAAIEDMARRAKALGGYVSYKTNLDGSTSPYELNINFMDALADPATKGESPELIVHRFLASQAVMLALQGVPGIYFHSLFGSRGWLEGVKKTGRSRTINRQKLNQDLLEVELKDPHALRYLVFRGYCHLLNKRRSTPAFHPNSLQKVLYCHESVFCLLRSSLDGRAHVLCLQNVSPQSHNVLIDISQLPLMKNSTYIDLISQQTFRSAGGKLQFTLEPYQVLWLESG